MKKAVKFAENLKYYRTKHKMTQKELAKLIGYTEKSISQWECADALPTVNTFIELAEIFRISIDELIFEKTSGYYFLGIDGGGTKTVFKLTDENGNVINELSKGSTNPVDIGLKNACEVLKDGIYEVCNGIPYSEITMFAGLSGGGLTSDNARKLKCFFDKFGFFAFENGSDIENLVALSEYERCILVIMGTGFIVYALNGNEKKRIAGWGQLFDDGGSGYTIGRDVITAALSESDGSGEKTLLTSLLENRINESAQAHLVKFYNNGKKYIAQFSGLAFTAAKQGDRVALDILEKNAEFAAEKIKTAVMLLTKENDMDTVPVLFSGGVSENHGVIFPLIKKYVDTAECDFIRIESEQVDGALKRARQIFLSKTER